MGKEKDLTRKIEETFNGIVITWEKIKGSWEIIHKKHPSGAWETSNYDKKGKLYMETHSDGFYHEYRRGRLVKDTYPDGSWTSWKYSDKGNLSIKEFSESEREIQYFEKENRISKEDFDKLLKKLETKLYPICHLNF